MVRTLRYRFLKPVYGFLCGKLMAKSAKMRWTYVIHHANDVYSGGPEAAMTRRFWIRMIIHRNGRLTAKWTVSMLCTILDHPMTVSMFLK